MKNIIRTTAVMVIELICAAVTFMTMVAFGLFIAVLFGRIS